MFSDHFDVLMSKIIFLKKNIILICFKMKNTLKSNRYLPNIRTHFGGY